MIGDCANGKARDLLPGYVHGTLAAAEHRMMEAHVASCADCTAEAGLIAAAARAFPAPAIDVARIVKALPAAPRPAARARASVRAWRVAAAIGIFAIGAFSVVALRDVFSAAGARTAASRAQGAGTVVAASGPAVAAADSPARVNHRAVSPRPKLSTISFGGGLSDLTDDQLDTLLDEIDTLDALPSVEPETHLTPILPETDGGHNAR